MQALVLVSCGKPETSVPKCEEGSSTYDERAASTHAKAAAAHQAAALAVDRAGTFPHSALAKSQAVLAWERARQASEATPGDDEQHHEAIILTEIAGSENSFRVVANLHREIANSHREAVRCLLGRPTGSDAHQHWATRGG